MCIILVDTWNVKPTISQYKGEDGNWVSERSLKTRAYWILEEFELRRWEGQTMVDGESRWLGILYWNSELLWLLVCWESKAIRKVVSLESGDLRLRQHFCFGCGYSPGKYWGRIKELYSGCILGLWRLYFLWVHIRNMTNGNMLEALFWLIPGLVSFTLFSP